MVRAVIIRPRSDNAESSTTLDSVSYDGITINFDDNKSSDNFYNGYTDGSITSAFSPSYQSGLTWMLIDGSWPSDPAASNGVDGINTISLNGTDLTTRYIPVTFTPGDRAADYMNMYWEGHGDNVGTLADNFEELKLVDISVGYDNDFNEVNQYGINSSFDFLTGTTSWGFSPDISTHITVDTTNRYIASDKSGSFNSGASNILWGKTYAIQIKPKASSGGADPITFSSLATFSVQENQTSVGTVQASGGDGTALTFSITGGDDAAKFSINSTGALTFNSAPDYETPGSAASSNTYYVTVQATDGTSPVTQSIIVNVTDVSESTTIVITTTTFTVNENQTSVGTIGTTGGDGSTKTYSITGGADQSSFNINDSTGVLAFNSAPDFESKSSYTINVNVSDSTYNVLATITVNIGNVQEGLGATLPTISGTAALGGLLTASTTGITDPDGISGGFTYQWKRDGSAIAGQTSSTYTVVNDDIGKTITVTVTYTDGKGDQQSLTSAGTTVAALDDKIYFWTEYFADASYNIPANSTLIYYGIYNTTKISGVILNYAVSGTTTVPDVSYNEQDQVDNNTTIYLKDWPIHVINTRTDTSETSDTGVENQQMVFAGAMNQSINGMNTGVFAIVRGNITLISIAALVDNTSTVITVGNYSVGKPTNPPEITEPGGRPLGDINYDGSLNDVDIEIMSAYLLNDTGSSFNVYDGDSSTVLYTGKTAIEIIGTIDTDGKIVTQGLMSEYDILTYIDVNNNNIIDVGDLVRMLSKKANPLFNITNGI